jgi:EF hand
MNKKPLLLAIAGIVGLTAVGGIAYADRGQRGGGHRGGHMMDLAERYDANKDGKVTQEEIDANRVSTHAQFDADKSGDLSLAEFQALWTEANKDRMVREFQRFDADGDSRATLDEYKKPLATIVADRDRNGDNALSKEDRPQRHGKHRERQGMLENQGSESETDAPPPPPRE